MKMKERFHAVCRFLNMISQGNHRVLFWLFGSAFAAATLPYLSLFFSARILNLLLAESYRACLYTVVVFLLVQYGLGLFEKVCRQYLDGQKEFCLALIEQKITAKALELEFEKFEKTETMDAIRRTNVSSMGSGNVGDQLIVIHTMMTSLLSLLYALFFLLRLFLLPGSSMKNFFTSPFSTLALLLLCGLQLALSSRINRESTQKKIELNQGNDHSNSVANYLVNVMLEERRADDIRIGHLDGFLDAQFGKAMAHFLPMYLGFARFSAVTDGKNALLSLLSNFTAYLLIGAKALYGVLPIGDVLLYAGSVTRALYKDAPFVILDEPTAALDPIAEAEIYEQFSQMTAGKTAVYISHRMSSCKFCDRIIVLDHGRIAEDGTHDTLLANHGIYANLYETQAQYYT